MKISRIFVYPIKSLRGCSVAQAVLTPQGVAIDRRYMLLKVLDKTPRELENMHVFQHPAMCLFSTSMDDDFITVTWHNPEETEENPEPLRIPIEPNFEVLEPFQVKMHSSPSKGYDMGKFYNDWFSARLGFEVILAYWGWNERLVLGNLPGKPATAQPASLRSGWGSTILNYIPKVGKLIVGTDETIAFNDVAPYLVVTEESLNYVSGLLPDGIDMDITKFRANIVVEGTPGAWDEDYWGEITVNNNIALALTANCARCMSINVDYKTGKFGEGDAGTVLKRMMKTRRVDPGLKYSPVFGRYGFLGKGDGEFLQVGDEVDISKRNTEMTRFYWPGIST